MSILPEFKATLADSLSAEERVAVVQQIKKITGVLKAEFNDASNPNQVLVRYYFTLNSVNNSVEDRARKIPGVVDTKPVL